MFFLVFLLLAVVSYAQAATHIYDGLVDDFVCVVYADGDIVKVPSTWTGNVIINGQKCSEKNIKVDLSEATGVASSALTRIEIGSSGEPICLSTDVNLNADELNSLEIHDEGCNTNFKIRKAHGDLINFNEMLHLGETCFVSHDNNEFSVHTNCEHNTFVGAKCLTDDSVAYNLDCTVPDWYLPKICDCPSTASELIDAFALLQNDYCN